MKILFIPKRIIYEKDALKYDIGKNILSYFEHNKNIEMIELKSNRIKENIPGHDIKERYHEGKNTLVLGIKKNGKFQTCKPSAHYQLPLLSGCMGHCQYCYLNTNLGDKPYVKINVNLEDILNTATQYMNERKPEITIFEGSATSDPVAAEPYSHILKQTIEFFSHQEYGSFRFVTKYSDIDTLLEIKHNNRTEIRFTLNTNKVIEEYEGRISKIERRLEACKKIIEAGYPLGFIIAPVFLYENWMNDYQKLLEDLSLIIPNERAHPITFEIISHRYTSRAKNIITEVFPQNQLPMNDEERVFKYGQFGYGKYLYTKTQINEMKSFFQQQIEKLFMNYEIKYII